LVGSDSSNPLLANVNHCDPIDTGFEMCKRNHIGIFRQLSGYLREERIAFFVGAGASAESPSCLPVGNDFRWLVLEALGFSELALDPKTETYHMTLELMLGQSRRFLSANEVQGIYEVLHRRRAYNRCHFLLPRICSTILTTNQDTLIEDADLSLAKICTKKEFEDYRPGPSVLHLHGSIEAPETLAVTHRDTSRLPRYKFDAMKSALIGKRALCFVGYSAQDLDIMDSFEKLGEREIFWIRRPTTPDKAGEWVQRIGKILHTDELTIQRHTIWAYAGTAMTVLAAQYKPALIEKYGSTPNSNLEKEAQFGGDFKRRYINEFVNEWKSTIPGWRRHAALATIIAHRWRGRVAGGVFSKVLEELQPSNGDSIWKAQVLIERARAEEAAGEYILELEDAGNARRIFEHAHDSIGMARACLGLAAGNHIQDRPEKLIKARYWIRQSQRHYANAHRHDADLFLWIIHTDAEISSKLGRALADITPRGEVMIRSAISRLTEAKIWDMILDDVDMETFVRLNLAESYMSLTGGLSEARHHLGEATRKIEWIGKPQAEVHAFRVAGRLNQLEGDLDSAKLCYDDALALSCSGELQEKTLVAKDSIAQALFFLERRRFQDAYWYIRLSAQNYPGTFGKITFLVSKLLMEVLRGMN
jgi:hypothetical protein